VIRAYRQFLTLRDRPDPGPIAEEVTMARRALAALTRVPRNHKPSSLENVFDLPTEEPRQHERERQARVVFPRLDRVDRLPRDTCAIGKVLLRPAALSAELSQTVLYCP
jgi:hypothetical protein